MPAHNDASARRGWRIGLVLVHLASMTMIASALGSAVWQRTHVEPTLFRGGLVYDWGMPTEQIFAVLFMDQWGTCGQLCLLAVGIYLTALIARGDRRVPRYYVWYGVALLVFEAVLNRTQVQLWDIPRGTARAWYASYVTLCAAGVAAWAVYVWRSRTVRAAFVHESRATGTVGRVVITCAAAALIMWPFVLNGFVDATSRVAGYISPRDTTAGEGFAEGIMAASAATGLLLWMKYTWHMRNGWIAVLWPVGFAALVVLYQMQWFQLHWTF